MEFDDVSQLRRRRDREIPLLSFPMTPVNPDVPSKWGHYRQILNDLFSNNSNNTKKRKRSVLYSDRVLDAIGLEDADHLNVLDWNPSILLSIVLDDTVHLWNPNSSADCVLTTGESGGGSVTSVSWAPDGRHIAIGLDNGRIQLWDAEGKRKLRTLMSRSSRIGALAWQGNILTSGGSDGLVIDSDPRLPSSSVVVHTYRGHRRGDICGLEWADSGFKQLASGGRDGLVYIWDSRIEDRWMFRLRAAATGAVRALGWCPFRENLLATGGGVGGDADDDSNGSIKFWNTRTGDCVSSVTTGSSQVCSLLWSKSKEEILSSCGGNKKQLTLWEYPSMDRIGELVGHGDRVMYTALSPDGQSVASASGGVDLTLRLWNVFPPVPEDVPRVAFGDSHHAHLRPYLQCSLYAASLFSRKLMHVG